jgi:multiple sugar transport system substrate-binding protein
MKMSKRLYTWLAILLVLSLVLAACAQATPETVIEKIIETVVVEIEGETVVQTVEVVKTVEVAVEATPVPRGDVSLKVVPWLSTETDDASVKIFQGLVQKYHADHPDTYIDLVVSPLGGGNFLRERILSSHAVGADMGIFMVNVEDYTEFQQAGLLYPLDELVEEIGEENFLPGTLVRGDDGKIYMVGYNGASFTTVWVRTDLLEEAGLEPPTNFEEFLAAAEALTKDTNGDGEIDVYGLAVPASSDRATGFVLANFMYENCADIYDRQGDLVFDHPNTLKAIENFYALMPYIPPEASQWSWGDIINAMVNGRAAMGWYPGRLGFNLYNIDPELRAKLQPIHFSVGDDRTGFEIWDYFSVYGGVRYPDEALDFLKFFFEEQNLSQFLLTVPGHLASPIKGVNELILASDKPYVQEYNDQIAFLLDQMGTGADRSMQMGFINPETCEKNFNLNPMPWASLVAGNDPNINSLIVAKMFSGEMTPQQAFEWGIEQYQTISDEWKAENPDWEPAP